MRRLLAAAALGAFALVARRYLAVREDMARVPREFRSPLLPFVAGDTTAKSLPRARMVYGRFRTPSGRGVTVVERHVGPDAVPVTVTTPKDGAGPRPGVLYIHGGGMILGSPQAEAVGSGQAARELGAVVVSPDYRLAPEHPYPAAIDDAWAATVQLAAHGRQLGADPGRIVLVGDSSGGNLAASVALRARSRGGPAIAGQVLLYPVLAADRSAFASARAYAHGVPLGLAEMDWYTNAYLGGAPIGPDVAPLLNEDLEGLPPSLVVGAECDLLCDEGRAYAERMSSAGVFVRYELFRGTVHGFFALSGALDDAARVTALIAEYLQSLFGAEVDQIVPE